MALPNNKDLFQQLINLFKEGYKSSSKIFVWAKALNEWKRLGGIGVIVLIFCLIFFFVSKEFRQEAIVKDSAVSPISSRAHEIMSFVDVGRRSMEKREELLKELINLFKEGYKSSSKIFVWAKALNEWKRLGGIGVIVLIFCLIFFFVFKEFRQEAIVKDIAVSPISSRAHEIMSFVDVGRRSMEKREELLKELMETEENLANTSKEGREKKLNILSSLLESCREAKRYFMSAFSKARDPHLNPETGEGFDTLVEEKDNRLNEKPTVITFEEESSRWGNLCGLCADSLEKARVEPLRVVR